MPRTLKCKQTLSRAIIRQLKLARTIYNANQVYVTELVLSEGPKLCLTDADWILEDFSDSEGQVMLANFGTVWFEETVATTSSGKTLDIDDSELIDMANATATYCVASEWDNSDFQVNYA
jgi:hypothetical protein